MAVVCQAGVGEGLRPVSSSSLQERTDEGPDKTFLLRQGGDAMVVDGRRAGS